MGVYHLMGLGRSPGAIIGPISYLAHRYQRWNSEDIEFFADSGEAEQRQEGERVGDIQALILFTTSEILNGQETPLPYLENPANSPNGKSQQTDDSMQALLNSLLKKEWPKITQRKQVKVFWCEVDRYNIDTTYKRIAQVVSSLATGSGNTGKEMWMNLTGGNNVINFALQLSASLSGHVARLYYAQARNERAERCIRFTNEEDYWIDLPVIPLSIGELNRLILERLECSDSSSTARLLSLLKNDGLFYSLMQAITEPIFEENYLKPMWKARLLTRENEGWKIGSQWELIRNYQTIMRDSLDNARTQRLTLEHLAKNEEWITEQEISLN